MKFWFIVILVVLISSALAYVTGNDYYDIFPTVGIVAIIWELTNDD